MFQDRVMVSLTSLLVLASLFSQTSQAIPKTSYLKLIDVWYIFLIVFDFTVIMVVVLIEYFRLNKKKTKNSLINRSHSSSEQKQNSKHLSTASSLKHKTLGDFEPKNSLYFDDSIIYLLNKLSQVIFPVILIVFLAGFTTVAYMSIVYDK